MTQISILKALGVLAAELVKRIVNEIAGTNLLRDMLITPTAITNTIAEVCELTTDAIGDSPALVFTNYSTTFNTSLPSCIFSAFENVSTLSFTGIGLTGEIPVFSISPSQNLTYHENKLYLLFIYFDL